MGIWDSFRRFAVGRGNGVSRGGRKKRRNAPRATKARDLRMEQFEHRLLLSITPYENDATYFVDDFGNGYFVDMPLGPATDLLTSLPDRKSVV